MKKLLLALMAIFCMASVAAAKDTYSRDVSSLPKAAQACLKSNFKAKVSFVKTDSTLGYIDDYEVVLTDGTEIEFDRDGNWKNVEVANNKSVPAAFVLPAISSYVKSRHSGARVVGIEKERSGFSVETSNGLEMKFDRQGKFVRYDD